MHLLMLNYKQETPHKRGFLFMAERGEPEPFVQWTKEVSRTPRREAWQDTTTRDGLIEIK